MPEQALNSLPLGTIVHERYRVTAAVGRGGLGTVYQVTDVLFGKHNTYALKELVDQSPGARRQFELESRWLQSLDHNHIPKVREHFEWFGRLYLVMDFVDGENLEQKLQNASGRPFPEDQVLRWTLPVCDALQYLHSRVPPILHRDIKPANIVVTPAGHVVLVDLGIAKAHIPGGNQTGTFARKAGTEGYAPPEQYTASGQTGPWSDVYALGATLYQLLTGRVPPTAIERVTLDTALIPPSQVNPAISGWVSAALVHALALRPTERFQSVQAFAIALAGPTGRIASMLPNLWLTPPPTPSPLPTMQSSMGVPTPPSMGTGSWPDLSGIQASRTPPLTPPGSITNPLARQPSSRIPQERDRQMPLQLQAKVKTEVSAAARRENGVADSATLGPITKQLKVARRSRRRSTWFWGTAACAVVLVTAIVAAFIFNASAPPDRSSPRATVTGYFAALEAQNYTLAWQFSAAMITDATSQTTFIASLAQDDTQLGRVQHADVNHMTVENDSSGTTTIQVNVARAHSATVSSTLILGLYNGSLWLINSITTP